MSRRTLCATLLPQTSTEGTISEGCVSMSRPWLHDGAVAELPAYLALGKNTQAQIPRHQLARTKKRSRRKSPKELETAKTRAQQDSKLYNLTLDINDLKQELRNLALKRELLHTRSLYTSANSPSSVMRTVAHYFHGFEHGYRGEGTNPAQYAFVQSIADDGLSLGITGLGLDMLMEQWRRYTETFHIRENVVRSVELITSTIELSGVVVVKCAVDFCGVFTRTAVDTVFPNAWQDPAMILQVLGRETTIPMLFHLYFNEDGLLVRHDAVADFFTAVRTSLGGDTNSAARFVEDACVGQESMIGPISECDQFDESTGTKKPRPIVASMICSFIDVGSEGHTSVEEAHATTGSWISDAEDDLSTSEVLENLGVALVEDDDDFEQEEPSRHTLAFLLS